MTDLPASVAAEVFISYSSHDRDVLEPIVQIVRTLKKNLVFQDYASIVPGERWRERVMDAIAHAKTVIVFWCEHSAASEHVRDEYEAGLKLRKEVVPILLDDTALPVQLREFHRIDLRRPERHGGLLSFIPLNAEWMRRGRHFYPKDEHGNYRDWAGEEIADKQHAHHREWENSQEPIRQEIARVIVTSLDTRQT